ncbi:MAG: hypothetical protein ACHQZS_06045 [Candidatus Binatales bacterium]
MKLGHTAALALTGWYLITPRDMPSETKPLSPLSQWEVRQTFDTAAQCERELIKQLDAIQAARKAEGVESERENRNGGITSGHLTFYSSEYQKCVATNDPRLAK